MADRSTARDGIIFFNFFWWVGGWLVGWLGGLGDRAGYDVLDG